MTNLISKQIRDNANIDSFERLIVFSALLLRSALIQGDGAYKGNVTFAIEELTLSPIDKENPNLFKPSLETCLTIKVSLPYRASEFLASGGDFLEYIESLSSVTPQYLGSKLKPSAKPLNITELPIVDNLETFLAWLLSTYFKLLPSYYSIYWKQVGYSTLFDASDNPKFSARVSLPIDYAKYTETSNILECVKQIVLDTIPVSFSEPQEPEELGYWDKVFFGNNFMPNDNTPPKNITNSTVINTISMPNDFTVTVQNNFTDSGAFEQIIITNEEKKKGWKITEFSITSNNANPNKYTVSNTAKKVTITNYNFIPSHNAYFDLYDYKITGYFDSSQYSQEGASWAGSTTWNYLISNGTKNYNKKITVNVLPQIDFIGTISEEKQEELEIELAEEKLNYFASALKQTTLISDKSVVSFNIFKWIGFNIQKVTINNVEYTNNLDDLEFTDYKLEFNGNNLKIYRYNQQTTVIAVKITAIDNTANTSKFYNQTQELTINLDFKYLSIIANKTLIDNDTLINNISHVSSADLINLVGNNLFTTDLYQYQWNYLKLNYIFEQTNNGNLAESISRSSFWNGLATNFDYGCFEGVIRLEQPDTNFFIKLSTQHGFKVRKVADMVNIVSAEDWIDSMNQQVKTKLTITTKKSQPNWNKGLVTTIENNAINQMLLFDSYIGKTAHFPSPVQYVKNNQNVNLNIQDLHFAVTWAKSNNQYNCILYLNGNNVAQLVMNTQPLPSLAIMPRIEFLRATSFIGQPNTFGNKVSANIADYAVVELFDTTFETDRVKILTYSGHTEVDNKVNNPTNPNFSNTPFDNHYVLKSSRFNQQKDYALLKNLRLSNTMRYTGNFNPLTGTYLL